MAALPSIVADKGKTVADGKLAQLLHRVMLAKKKLLPSFILTVLEGIPVEQKVAIFAFHLAVHEAICDALESAGIGYINITGATKMKERPAMLNRLKTDATCRVGVLSLGACSTGTNSSPG